MYFELPTITFEKYRVHLPAGRQAKDTTKYHEVHDEYIEMASLQRSAPFKPDFLMNSK
jgi:hypothetical protein